MTVTNSLATLTLVLALVLTGCTASPPSEPVPQSAPTPPAAAADAPASGPLLAGTGPQVTVTEMLNGTPVANALVWVAGLENMGRTDGQGRTQLMAPLPPGEQTLFVTPIDLAAHKESQFQITVLAGDQQEYSLMVSPDRPLTFVHGQEVPTPAFIPAPQRVSPEKIQRSATFRQVHALRQAHSAWLDGEGQAGGFWEPFVVWTGSDPDHPAIGTYLLNGGGKWNARYDCPRPIGLLTITGIDPTGLLVSFSATSEVTGTFHLVTHEWRFD